MALTTLISDIANSPDALKALYASFSKVEVVPRTLPEGIPEQFKVFRIQGQGVPASDKYVTLEFERDLRGNLRISHWEHTVDQNLGI